MYCKRSCMTQTPWQMLRRVVCLLAHFMGFFGSRKLGSYRRGFVPPKSVGCGQH
jgi:hypothetical protein